MIDWCMTLPDHLRRLAVRVAQHEMGHYVVARALGFRTGDVSIEIIGPIDGHHGTAAVTLPEPIVSIDELCTYLERRVIVLYAGGAAEALAGCGSPTKKVDVEEAVKIIRNPGQGAEQDHAKARELIHVLRNVSMPESDTSDDAKTQSELDEIDAKLFSRAVELVEENAETIIGLAGNLADRVNAPKTKVKLDAAYLEGLQGVQQIAQASPSKSANKRPVEPVKPN
jgi:hypothetical protein